MLLVFTKKRTCFFLVCECLNPDSTHRVSAPSAPLTPRLVFSKNKNMDFTIIDLFSSTQSSMQRGNSRLELIGANCTALLQRKPRITIESNSGHCTKLYTLERHTGFKNKSCGSLSTGQATQREGSRHF